MLPLCCQTRLKKSKNNGTQSNFVSQSSNMIFIFHIDKVFINYSCNDDKLSLSCQTRLKSKKFHPG